MDFTPQLMSAAAVPPWTANTLLCKRLPDSLQVTYQDKFLIANSPCRVWSHRSDVHFLVPSLCFKLQVREVVFLSSGFLSLSLCPSPLIGSCIWLPLGLIFPMSALALWVLISILVFIPIFINMASDIGFWFQILIFIPIFVSCFYLTGFNMKRAKSDVVFFLVISCSVRRRVFCSF